MAPMARDRQPALLGTLYAEDFDAPPRPAGPPPPPPPPVPAEPVFTTADLAAARAEGRAAGMIESERGIAATQAQMLTLIASGLNDAQPASAAVTEAVAEAVARAMLGALAACLPALCAQHGEGELRALVRALAPGLTAEPCITVRVHPMMAPAMTEEIAALEDELAGRVQLVATEQVSPGDARVSWRDGGAVRNAHQIRTAVEDSLAALGLLERENIDA